jgi:hypothetical protein
VLQIFAAVFVDNLLMKCGKQQKKANIAGFLDNGFAICLQSP